MKANFIPEGFHTVTPYLLTRGADKIIDFTKRVFDAEEISRMDHPDGSVMHAQLRIGDSIIMLAEASSEYPAMPTMLYLYVENVDEAYDRAIKVGGVSLREPTDEYYGDRSCGVQDAGGNQWWIATHLEDISPQEAERRAKELAH